MHFWIPFYGQCFSTHQYEPGTFDESHTNILVLNHRSPLSRSLLVRSSTQPLDEFFLQIHSIVRIHIFRRHNTYCSNRDSMHRLLGNIRQLLVGLHDFLYARHWENRLSQLGRRRFGLGRLLYIRGRVYLLGCWFNGFNFHGRSWIVWS